MPNVWLPTSFKSDVSDAGRFGEVIVCIRTAEDPFNIERIRRVIREEVLPASQRDDFLLFASPAIVMATVLTEWLSYYGEARCLFFRDSKRCYVERILRLDNRDKAVYNGKHEPPSPGYPG